MPDYTPYNPLDDESLAQNVADALEREPVHLLPLRPFPGAGLYAIYYVGDNELYRPLADMCTHDGSPENLGLGPFATPIYVGRASSGSTRTGAEKSSDKALYRRLRDHTSSIRAAENLHLEDFRVRYLRVKDIWIPLGEHGIISRYVPIWNRALDGFGNHGQGGGRGEQKRSRWDMVHPGRSFAMELKEHPEGIDYIRQQVINVVAEVTA